MCVCVCKSINVEKCLAECGKDGEKMKNKDGHGRWLLVPQTALNSWVKIPAVIWGLEESHLF